MINKTSNSILCSKYVFPSLVLCLLFLIYSQLKGLNLNGVIPDEFGNLTYLREM